MDWLKQISSSWRKHLPAAFVVAVIASGCTSDGNSAASPTPPVTQARQVAVTPTTPVRQATMPSVIPARQVVTPSTLVTTSLDDYIADLGGRELETATCTVIRGNLVTGAQEVGNEYRQVREAVNIPIALTVSSILLNAQTRAQAAVQLEQLAQDLEALGVGFDQVEGLQSLYGDLPPGCDPGPLGRVISNIENEVFEADNIDNLVSVTRYVSQSLQVGGPTIEELLDRIQSRQIDLFAGVVNDPIRLFIDGVEVAVTQDCEAPLEYFAEMLAELRAEWVADMQAARSHATNQIVNFEPLGDSFAEFFRKQLEHSENALLSQLQADVNAKAAQVPENCFGPNPPNDIAATTFETDFDVQIDTVTSRVYIFR